MRSNIKMFLGTKCDILKESNGAFFSVKSVNVLPKRKTDKDFKLFVLRYCAVF